MEPPPLGEPQGLSVRRLLFSVAKYLQAYVASYGFEISKTEHELDMRLSKWFALYGRDDDADRHADSGDASRDGTAKPTAATGSEPVDDDSMSATGIASRHDDGSFPFPRRLRHRHSIDDGAPRPPWWRTIFR